MYPSVVRPLCRPSSLTAVACALTLAAGLLLVTGGPADAASAVSSRAGAATVAVAARSVPAAVRPGMVNLRVQRLQRLLHVKPASGWYGPRTRAAVRAYKSSHGLGHGARFGARAWRTLLAERARSTAAAPRASARSGRVCPAPRAHFGNDYGDARTGHRHAGIDMLGKRGMPLYAIEDGYVVRAGRQSNGALRIVIQGTQTGAKYYYGHNSRHLLHAGQHFRAGAVIALMGDTGSPGINHLHFEWWRSGGESAHVNPYQLLRSIC